MEIDETEMDGQRERAAAAIRVREVRGSGWDSAFYRFAEAVRALTAGSINYKIVYALVGINGRYVNHASPIVRKRTAASLSRLMHSSRYAADLRENYQLDNSVFITAATEVAQSVRTASGSSDAELMAEFGGPVWDEVCRGLESERLGGRDVNLARIERESAALHAWCATELACDRAPLVEVIAACFHMMAFGYLDERFARSLCARTPLDAEGVPAREFRPREDAACLIRVAPEQNAPVSGCWRVRAEKPFTIGRYTDCDAIETDPLVSRLHCRIYRFDNAWYVEDTGSRYGTRVLRGPAPKSFEEVFDSLFGEGGPSTCRLEYGDCIVLANRVTYWFRSLDENELV